MNNAERHYQFAIKLRDQASQESNPIAKARLIAQAQLEATLALFPQAQYRVDYFPLPESFFDPAAEDKPETGQ